MSIYSLPNALSILRIILAVPVVIFLLNHQFFGAMIVFFFAGITDGLDGWIAKQYNCQSRLGSILDPAADKLLVLKVPDFYVKASLSSKAIRNLLALSGLWRTCRL